jgi:predicted nuclease of predicted toxin-antitoxin system
MKLLLDENIPEKLRQSFDLEHEVYTVRYMGWSGLKNGNLMQVMMQEAFEGLVTMDKNLPNQQNLTQSTHIIFILDAPDNKISTLLPYVVRLNLLLSSQILEKVIEISL